jgi:hypothetical protein
VNKPPHVPRWVQDVVGAIEVDSLTKFILLCSLHDQRGRRFEPPQLPNWSPPRDGAIRETLDGLAAQGVLFRQRGRREASYTYDPKGQQAEAMERFFAFLEDASCRRSVLRWIVAGHPRAPSWTATTRPA